MIRRVGDTQPPAPKGPGEGVPFKTALENFTTKLREIMHSPHLADSGPALQSLANTVVDVDKTSKQAAETDNEDLQDAGEIAQNILTQPLSIPGAKADISLLEAVHNFDAKNEASSDLRKILLSFLQFPAPTETMLRELEILQDEM